jgi:hypothetical protein
MTVYQSIVTSNNLSQLIAALAAQDDAVMSLQRGITTPTVKPVGSWWNRTDYPTLGNAVMVYNGTAYQLLMDPDAPQLNALGTVPLAADLPAGGFKLTGLAAGSGAGHSVRYEQVLLLAGGTMAGAINMGGQAITNLAAPVNNNDAARKVDLFTNQNGLANRDENVQLEQQASTSTTFQQVQGGPNGTFVPLEIVLEIKGTLRDQSDNDAHGDVDLKYRVQRWDLNAITLESTLLPTGPGATQMTIELEWKTTAPRGFRLRIYRNDNGEFQNVTGSGSFVRAISYGAVGELS